VFFVSGLSKGTRYFSVTWREAAAIRRQLDRIGPIPYVVTSLPTGEVTFVFPDLPVRLYAQLRRILTETGDRFLDLPYNIRHLTVYLTTGKAQNRPSVIAQKPVLLSVVRFLRPRAMVRLPIALNRDPIPREGEVNTIAPAGHLRLDFIAARCQYVIKVALDW
jgi:hypothetical protein